MKAITSFKTIYTYIINLILLISPLMSQTVISLDEAVILAKNNNPEMKILQTRENIEFSLIKAVNIFSPLQVSTTLGQFNSSFFDQSLSLTQEFSSPGFYKTKKQWQRQKYSSTKIHRKWMEANLKLDLEMIFIRYNYLLEKEKLLFQKDSLFSLFLEKVNFQVDLGDSGIMPKIMAEQQKFQVAFDLATNLQNQKEVKIEFEKLVFNIEKDWKLSYPFIVKNVDKLLSDTLSIQNHPEIEFLRQEQQLARLKTNIENTLYWPTFSIGYQNTSIQGTGADNIHYPFSRRFSSVQIGINIPISYKAIHHQIQATRLQEEAAYNQLEFAKWEKKSIFQQRITRYKHLMSQIANFENNLIPGLKTIQEISQASFENGQTNLLEYVLLLSQSFDLQMQYLDLKNEAIMEEASINYLFTK